MAFIPTPNAVEIRINWTHQGVPAANVLHFENTGVMTSSNLRAIADAVRTVTVSRLLGVLAGTSALLGVDARDVSVTDGQQATSTLTGPTAGAAIGEAISASVAAVLTLRTGASGRSRRGRKYISGFTEASLTGRVLSQAAVEAVENWGNDLLGIEAPAGFALAVRTLFTGGAPRAAGQLTRVTGVLVRSSIVGSQRNRVDRP